MRRPADLANALYLGARARREAAGAKLAPDRPRTTTLTYEQAKALVSPLDATRIIAAFRKEFADTSIEVASSAVGTVVRGSGWELTLADGADYVHVSCRWNISNDEVALMKLKRAALRAGLSTFDPQTEILFAPT